MDLRTIVGFALGPIASAALGLVAVPIAAWAFAPEDVGRLNVLQITLSFILLLSVLGLDQAYVREYHESANKPQLLRTCFLPGLTFFLMVGLSGLFFASALSKWLFGIGNKWLFFGVLICIFLDYINRFLSLILRMKEQAWAYSTSQVVPKIVQIIMICGLLLLSLDRSFSELLLIILASNFSVTVVFMWYTKRDLLRAIRSQINTLELKKLLNFGLPLIFSGMAYWGLIATSTVALRLWSSLDELAIYSVANSFAGAAAVFQSIFTVIWAPTVYKWVSQGEVSVELVYGIAKQALAILCAMLTIGGGLSWICDLILPSSYNNVKYILMCLMLQPLLYTLSEITSVGIGIQRKTIFSVWITGCALLTNIGLCSFLVPKFGAAGAAAANAIAFAVFFIGRTEISSRIWRKLPRGRLYMPISVLLIIAATMALNRSFANSTVYSTWCLMFFISLLIFRNEWKNIIGYLQSRAWRSL